MSVDRWVPSQKAARQSKSRRQTIQRCPAQFQICPNSMLPWCPAVIRSEVPVSENPQSQRCRVLRLADNDISQTVELWMVRKISFRTDIRTDITWIKLGIGCRINFK